MSWKSLGATPPSALVDARLQLHHAAQVVAAAGGTFLEPRPDDSHPNLAWVERLDALVGRGLPGVDVRVGLRVSDLSLLLIGSGGDVQDEIALSGKTLADGYAWLSDATTRAGMAPPPAGIIRSAYDIPKHATGSGAAFSLTSPDAFAEIARWFANGHHVLTEVAALVPGASDVRCWPHHFDIGALVTVETGPDGSLAKSIGLGLSPGDDGYPEPYWYVSPWPYPEPSALPPLESGGHWHTDGYTSAILTGSGLVEGPRGGQYERLRTFLDAAVDISRRILAD